MIKKGDKVIVRAICRGDAWHGEVGKSRFVGKQGVVMSEPGLMYWSNNSTFAGEIHFESGESTVFHSIQVKKVKE